MRELPVPSRTVIKAVAVLNLVLQATIAVTGTVVRVTGSGLGCPTWPQCFPGSMFPVQHPEYSQFHQWVEFGNRMLNGVIGVVAIAVFLVVWLRKPRRPRLVKLALAMPLGVLAQAVIGGITVRTGLVWWTVAFHLLASSVLVWFATHLVYAINEGDGKPRRVGPPVLAQLVPVQAAVLAALLVAGTMVTGAGPHAGDEHTPRLDLPVPTLAHTHAALMFIFLGMLLAAGLLLRVTESTPTLWRRYLILLCAVIAQGSLGFIQYWTGVPALVVPVHVFGAMMVIIALASFRCATTERAEAAEPMEPATPAESPLVQDLHPQRG